MTTSTKKDEAESVGPSGAPTAQSLDVTEVLKRAREKVAAGWCQQAFHDGERYCSYGAIAAALGVKPILLCRNHCGQAAVTVLAEAIDKPRLASPFLTDCGDPPYWVVSDWNDAEGRTQAEVLATFDLAITLSEVNAPQAPQEAVAEAPHGK